MRAGFGRADITPRAPGLTLSGFAARLNKPSTGVHDPIMVRALALQDGAADDSAAHGGGVRALLLVFDLLAIGAPLAGQIHKMLDDAVGDSFPKPSRILCTTHTHSAPASIRLIGCGIEEQSFWDHLLARTREAALQAVRSLSEARLSLAEAFLPGINFNRHIVLKDGRVVMSPRSPELIARQGKAWERALFVKLERADTGAPIAALMHWAAHPTTTGQYEISADYPGGLCRELEAREGIPFIFLQGASGNLNVPFKNMTFADTERTVDAIMKKVPALEWRRAQEPVTVELLSRTAKILYQPVSSPSELLTMQVGMEEIAKTGNGDARNVAMLSNILNVAPGEAADPGMLRYIASILAEWARDTARLSAGPAEGQAQGHAGAARSVDLAVHALRLGPIVFVCAAAEVFVETAYALAGLFPDALLAVVGYAAPLVGYLPTDRALEEGGYEAEYAYRFYGHPAPFAKGSEQELIATARGAVSALLHQAPATGARRKP